MMRGRMAVGKSCWSAGTEGMIAAEREYAAVATDVLATVRKIAIDLESIVDSLTSFDKARAMAKDVAMAGVKC
jgi:hypothetical protein